MCGSMVDVQSAMDEIRREKKEDRKKKPHGKNIMSGSAMQGDYKEIYTLYKYQCCKMKVML